MTTELTENELYLLYSLLNDRIIEASNAGLPDDHDSSAFRMNLAHKLIPFLHRGTVSISSATEQAQSAAPD